MDLYNYKAGLELMKTDPPFYALIQCAMRKADTVNELKLRTMWPEVWDDLKARYNAPGGVLPGEN